MKSNKNKIIVFANQKGGVGKSTLCILLANYLAYWKKDVCIIDTDLQQSATLQREQDKQTFGDADECACGYQRFQDCSVYVFLTG